MSDGPSSAARGGGAAAGGGGTPNPSIDGAGNFSSADRRGSLGLDMIGDALFGRRSSGFGLDAFGDFGGGGGGAGTGRRGSLDSTTAVLDAAIMDLTRRRLSMAMGGPAAGVPGPGVGDSNDPLNFMGYGIPGAPALSANPNGAPVANNNSSNNVGSPAVASAAASNAVQSINIKQEQLQNQQKELERRQKELEAQRQQLLSAMEERRKVMQQMQSNIQTDDGQANGGGNAGGGGQQQNPRNSLLGSLGGGGIGANPGFGTGGGNDYQLLQSLNAANFRRSSVGGGFSFNDAGRRGSLDLLGALAGGQSAGIPGFYGSNQNSFQQQVQEVSRRLSMAGGAAMANMNANANQQSTTGAIDTSLSALQTTTNSQGPFSMLEKPVPLSMSSDKDWLTPLHCFVRQHCVEIFTATEEDVATPSKGKRKPIHVGQIGIRCPYSKGGERGSVYYPTSISSIYNATMNLLQRHFHNCTAVPTDLKKRYETLKADDARSGTSKKYWIESALSLGLVDTPTGIRYSAVSRPPLPSLEESSKKSGGFNASGTADEDFYNSESNALTDLSQRSAASGGDNANAMDKSRESDKVGNKKEDVATENTPASHQPNIPAQTITDGNIPETEQSLAQSAPLVTSEDEPYATAFSFHLLSQMQPCVFTEADRLGKRKGLPPGFPGLACRHCFGGYGSGRFFPSSIKTLSDTSKTLNVLHNHMMRCRKCPVEVRETLKQLRTTHDEERAKMKFGSQKAFFARVWDRLHEKDPHVNSKRKFEPPNRKKKATTGTAKKTNSNQNIVTGGNFASAAAQFQQQSAFLEAAGLQAGLAGFGGNFSGYPGGMPGSMQDYLAMQQYAAAGFHPGGPGFGNAGMQQQSFNPVGSPGGNSNKRAKSNQVEKNVEV
eukprot:CAMPEP_0113521184 /NCGR_PEP_ID=MMETSP0014_2-20120614/44501_1 /TAXON_ID=2857 /ORGANISM="Nitzschia sp." /LENGTH=887 /DNA_ID=CAMNT_0000419119 /DNA_START=382 /DNA_END=3045 /DNA_ORIENTATION=+ /assembly_acc=CAM_ASM_000159